MYKIGDSFSIRGISNAVFTIERVDEKDSTYSLFISKSTSRGYKKGARYFGISINKDFTLLKRSDAPKHPLTTIFK